MIATKIKIISESGIDISGLHEIEFEFYTNTKPLAEKLKRTFWHPDNSMRATIRKCPKSKGYKVLLRVDSYISRQAISSNLTWLNKHAEDNNALLETWRVVQRT